MPWGDRVVVAKERARPWRGGFQSAAVDGLRRTRAGGGRPPKEEVPWASMHADGSPRHLRCSPRAGAGGGSRRGRVRGLSSTEGGDAARSRRAPTRFRVKMQTSPRGCWSAEGGRLDCGGALWLDLVGWSPLGPKQPPSSRFARAGPRSKSGTREARQLSSRASERSERDETQGIRLMGFHNPSVPGRRWSSSGDRWAGQSFCARRRRRQHSGVVAERQPLRVAGDSSNTSGLCACTSFSVLLVSPVLPCHLFRSSCPCCTADSSCDTHSTRTIRTTRMIRTTRSSQ